MFLRLSAAKATTPEQTDGSVNVDQTQARFKQTASLETRLAQFARRLREQADQKPPGEERNSMMKRAYNADRAIDLERELRLQQ
jgi:hypothetical protein